MAGPPPLVRALIRRAWCRCSPPVAPPARRAGLGSTTTTQSGAGSSPNLERWFERCVHKFRGSHGAGSRKAGMFAGVMVAPRPRIVRGRYAIWPRGSKYSPRRVAAANKEKAAQARRGKGRVKSSIYTTPNPLQKDFVQNPFWCGSW